MDAGMNIREAR